jgi:hypothetical protein
MATSSAFATAFNKEPAMAVAGIIALGALVLPYVVVPIRRSMGLPTYQWDADPKTHPVSCLSVFFYLSPENQFSYRYTISNTYLFPTLFLVSQSFW